MPESCPERKMYWAIYILHDRPPNYVAALPLVGLPSLSLLAVLPQAYP